MGMRSQAHTQYWYLDSHPSIFGTRVHPNHDQAPLS